MMNVKFLCKLSGEHTRVDEMIDDARLWMVEVDGKEFLITTVFEVDRNHHREIRSYHSSEWLGLSFRRADGWDEDHEVDETSARAENLAVMAHREELRS